MRFAPDIHHRRSIRLRGYDYAGDGAYFVTVCVQGRECLLGEVMDGTMVLSPAGEVVRSAWEGLPKRFPTMLLDAFVVMPNHFHGTLFLTDRRGEPCVRPMGQNDHNEQNDHNDQGDHKDRPYGTAPDSLGRIIQAFKSLSTTACIRGVERDGWTPFPGRLWQRNYHERILRNDAELARARQYIVDNPGQWHLDAENPVNVP